MRFFHANQSEGLLLNPSRTGLSIAVQRAGDAERRPHYHEHMRELGIVVTGHALLAAAGSEYELGPGSAVVIDPGEMHAWSHISSDLELMLIHEPFVTDDLVFVGIV